MSARAAIFALFAQALLIQSALSQVCGRPAFNSLGSYGLGGSALTTPFGFNGLNSGLLGNGLACNDLVIDSVYTPAVEITPTTGGGLPVTSASPIAPNSLVVASDNVYEGILAVGGELPFVGTVGLEGVLPTAGSGAVNHACGNGATRMVSLDGAAISSGFGAGFAPSAAFAPGNIYNGIGAYGNAAAVSPFGCGAGLGELAYPASGLTDAYLGNGFAGAYPGARFPAAGYGAAYGGAGEGNVAVAGELPVAGNTAVAGQVPIMGAVNFGGNVPAAGAVAISGNCDCGCNTPYAAGGIGTYGAGVAPLSLLPGAGFNAPVAGIVAPIDGCYPPGIYY